MKKIFITTMVVAAQIMSAQVGINTESPEGILDVQSPNKNEAMILPRVEDEVINSLDGSNAIPMGNLFWHENHQCFASTFDEEIITCMYPENKDFTNKMPNEIYRNAYSQTITIGDITLNNAFYHLRYVENGHGNFSVAFTIQGYYAMDVDASGTDLNVTFQVIYNDAQLIERVSENQYIFGFDNQADAYLDVQVLNGTNYGWTNLDNISRTFNYIQQCGRTANNSTWSLYRCNSTGNQLNRYFDRFNGIKENYPTKITFDTAINKITKVEFNADNFILF